MVIRPGVGQCLADWTGANIADEHADPFGQTARDSEEQWRAARVSHSKINDFRPGSR